MFFNFYVDYVLFKHNFFCFKVYLAMEAGYSEKVDELCDRYSLEGFLKPIGMQLDVCLCTCIPQN